MTIGVAAFFFVAAATVGRQVRRLAGAKPLLRAAATPDRIVGYVRRHPAGIAIAAAALAVLGPRKLLAAGTRLLTLYTLVRQLAR